MLALAGTVLSARSSLAADAAAVRIGIHDTPFSSYDAQGNVGGFYVELIQYIGAAEDWNVEYVTGSWPDLLQKFERGEIDLLFPMVPSEQGLARYDFTAEPVVSTWGRVFAPRALEGESLFDLRGRTVAVVENDLFGKELLRLLEKFEIDHAVHQSASTKEVFGALGSGLAEVAAVEQIDGSRHALASTVEETPIVFKPVAGHVAARRDRFTSQLLAIDRHLKALKDEPDSIYWRSYAELFAPRARSVFPRWTLYTLIGGAALLALLAAFVITLRIQVARGTRRARARNRMLEKEIARRSKAEQEKLDIEKQLREAQRLEAVGQLAGGVAHDFNNMLAAIIATSELALGRLAPEHEARRDIVETITVAGRAAALTRQLLAFGGKQTLRPQVIEPNRLLGDLEQILTRTIGEHIKLSFALEPELWPVMADRSQLQQVILNLVVNARDAMPEGGRVHIATSNTTLDRDSVLGVLNLERGDYVAISVTDNGIGMDEETRAQAFEPFFTTKQSEQHSGLGLSTSYGIVTQSGGTITIDGAPGAGTTVRVLLPRTAEALPRASKLASVAIKKSAATVLLVEDEDVVRRSVARLLQRSGLRPLPAADGEEALAISAEHQGPIHLILTDVILPGIKGPEVVKRIQIDRPESRAIYMSAQARELLSRDGMLDDEVELIDKPFTTPELLGRIGKVLEIEIE